MNQRPEDPLSDILELYGNDDAAAASRAIEQLDPTSLEPFDHGRMIAIQAACMAAAGRDDDVDSFIDRAMKEHDDPDLILALGIQLSELGGFDQSVRVLEALCDAMPDKALPFYNLGVAHQRADELDDAIEAFSQAVAIEPEHALAHLNRGHCHRVMGDFDLCEQSLTRYLELHPDDAEQWVALGGVQNESQRFAEAYQSFERAQALDPDDENLYFNWAVTAHRTEDRDRLQSCAEALEQINDQSWRGSIVAAFLAVADGLIWPGWELCLEALDRVGEDDGDDDDSDSITTAAEIVLRFALEFDLHEHTDKIIEHVIEHELFDIGVLEAIRELDGRSSEKAIRYNVLVEGAVTDPDQINRLTAPGAEPRQLLYYRMFQIVAESEADAREAALTFDRRIGHGVAQQVNEIEAVTEPAKDYLGVAQFTGMVMSPPADDEAA